MTYEEFIKTKTTGIKALGFDPPGLNKNLFDFQMDIVTRACKLGRFAVFADCGLGKTIMQLEIARLCAEHTGKKSVILTPLAVAEQTKLEAAAFGINLSMIDVLNYEQLHNMSNNYGCVCLDESSILKNFQGKTKRALIDFFQKTPYRFCFTATPSPNDLMEIGNHSEFLGQMKFKNMLSMYFINDMDTVQKWRLKGHAESIFWKWISSWSVCLTNPNDLGYCQKNYSLPALNIYEHSIETPKLTNGKLFNDLNVSSTSHASELRRTFKERTDKAIELSLGDDPVLVWTKHNDESEYLSKFIDGAVEVSGSMPDEKKKSLLLGFARGDFRVLVTKAKIAQYGLNYQHCSRQVFVSLDFSFESTYQAIRRSYRFGQKKEVDIHLISTDTMGNVVEAIKQKQEEFNIMQRNLVYYGSKF